jgi:ATP-dependent DNA ligase
MRLHHFVVGGWEEDFGAVLIAEHVDGHLRYFGKVASRFDRRKLESITRKLSLRKVSPFTDPIPEGDVRFCEPTVRVPVQFLEITESGYLRHARLRLFA